MKNLILFSIFLIILISGCTDEPIDENYCEKDEDCAPCGVGCATIEISQKDFCHVGLHDNVCVCLDNSCTVKEKEVTITTDKTEYEQGEDIDITVSNKLSQLILYPDGASGFWGLERFKDNQWTSNIGNDYSDYQIWRSEETTCYVVLLERPFLTNLDSGAGLQDKWNQKICPLPDGDFDPKTSFTSRFLDPGRYRFTFTYSLDKSDDFTMVDKQTIYSNEFTIKEKECDIEDVKNSEKFGGLLIIRTTEKNPDDEMKLFLYFEHELNDDEIQQIEQLGITIDKDSWIPPVGAHPFGFYIANSKVKDICKLVTLDLVKRVESGEETLEPLE